MGMTSAIDPVLHPVPIRKLRPTQLTVGMREVHVKRKQWRQRLSDAEAGEFLGSHMLPAVLGPGKKFWLIDHHHLARALLDEGVENALISVVAKLDALPMRRFFAFMESRNWLHPYDAGGERCGWKDLPRHVGKLVDDPYRSLAGEVRAAGGYAKTQTPYTEFLWADFYRERIKRSLIEDKWDKALARAVALAHSPAASYLPGFAGAQ